MQSESLNQYAQAAYVEFLESIRPIAPHMAEIQPEWDGLPEVLKQAWRNSVQVAIERAIQGNA